MPNGPFDVPFAKHATDAIPLNCNITPAPEC